MDHEPQQPISENDIVMLDQDGAEIEPNRRNKLGVEAMRPKPGDRVTLGNDAEPREGVVVDVSPTGEALQVAWSDGRRTVIAADIIARLANAESAKDTPAER